MPPRSELPGSVHRSSFLRALKRLGFEINETGGNGSHCKATWPKTQRCVTIQQRIDKDVLYYLLKEIETHSGVTWDEIKKEL
jgi:predicted RNA binding protein YcfA (HicA-like mRNA interferase family)